MLVQFAVKLRAMREQRGYTQADLTRLLGIQRAHISNLEAGRRQPSLELLIQIAILLNVSIEYLIDDALPIDSPRPPSFPYRTAQLSQQLRQLRSERGISQHELALALGDTTQAHISLIESGHKTPSIAFAQRLAAYFAVPISRLIFGGGEPAVGAETSGGC